MHGRRSGSRWVNSHSRRCPSRSEQRALDPASLTAAATNAVHSVDPELAVANVRTLERHASAALASRTVCVIALRVVCGAGSRVGGRGHLWPARLHRPAATKGNSGHPGGARRRTGEHPPRRSTRWFADGVRASLSCLLLMPIAARSLQAFLYHVGTYDLFTMTATPGSVAGRLDPWPASVLHGRQPETTRRSPFAKTEVGWFRFPEMVLSDVDIKRYIEQGKIRSARTAGRSVR